MNEIQKQNPTGVVMQTAPANVGFNFFDPVQFETMQRVSRMFAKSDLVPDTYKATVKQIPAGANENQVAAIQAENAASEAKAMANCMIAIDVAIRIGASPLMVMQNMAIIYGRPSWSSKFLIATVNSCGRFEPLQFKFIDKGNVGNVTITEYVWNDRTRKKEAIERTFDGRNIRNLECVAFTTQKGSPNVLESSPVSVLMAIQEGWFTKNGSKWVTMTRQMLMYRAASMWTNTFAPELSMGMRTVEEQQDIVDVEFEEIKHIDDAPTMTNASVNDSDAPIGFDAPESSTTDESGNKEEADPDPAPEASQPAQPETPKRTPGF